MNDHIQKILACPECKSDLLLNSNNEHYCSFCNKGYRSEPAPINFLQPENVAVSINEKASEERFKRFLRKVFNTIRPSSTFKTKKSKNRIIKLIASLSPEEVCVNIGSGKTNYSRKMVNIDVEVSDSVDILADGRKLPIKTGSVSLAVSQAVLEHTPDSKGNIDEITRILKTNGILYIEVPFMQTYHAHPHDYFRFTYQGIKSFLADYDVHEEGISVGPASATALNLRIFFATLFSFGNKKLFLIFNLMFSWLTLPIKYLDYFMERNPLSFYGASGIYVIARKKG